MTLFADLLSTVFERRYRPWGPVRRDSRPVTALVADLMGGAGEVTGAGLARQIIDRYGEMDDDAKLDFFRHIATNLAIVPSALRAALDAYEAEGQSKATYRAVMAASEPPRQELIRRLNQVPGATKSLVRMRADLLRLARGDEALQALDLDFRHLFASWFNRGFLVLRRISWESPADILEKIIAYEAVHAIDSWDDLRRRLQPKDRRCFAFFHPAMPDEPLIFVEVALTRGIAGSVQALLSENREVLLAQDADTAVFYSISNCQAGLAGISFGNMLIKQVAADLAAELPGLKTFITLSPIPGFASWLSQQHPQASKPDGETLRALAAHYLAEAKRPDGMPLDPVARFHLGNGAQLHDVHLNADTSPNGVRQSLGVMVNYHYDLKKVAENHERFATSQTVAMSSGFRSLSANATKLLTEEA